MKIRNSLLGAAVATLFPWAVQSPAASTIRLEIANYWVHENAGLVRIGLVRAGDEDTAVTVDFATADSTAAAGPDYESTHRTASFAPGVTIQLVDVPIYNDALQEGNEQFLFSLSNPSAGAALASPTSAIVTILDNDPGVQFTQSSAVVLENERSLLVSVTRGNDQLLGAFSVDYVAMDDTATSGSDYANASGTLAFAIGEMTKSFTVTIMDDGVAEMDEQFSIVLTNATGGRALGSSTKLSVTVCDTTEMLPHRIGRVQWSPDGTVSLTMGGGYTPGLGLSNRFLPYIDLYPLEVSSDLKSWSPLKLLVRTNDSTSPLVYIDTPGSQVSQRFYRVPTRSFLTPCAPPTGPHAVGRMDRWLSDPTRPNRFLISTNDSFQVAIWYPATPRAGGWPRPGQDEPILHDSSYWTGFTDRASQFVDYAPSGLSFATNAASYPVVLISPGHPATRDDLWDKGDELASHGYIVVAPDHYDAFGVVLPDGTYSSGLEGKGISVAGFEDRVKDLRFIVDRLEQWNASDPVFAGRLDLSRIAALGFSYGGGVVAEFCRLDPRGKVAIVLEGYFQNAATLLANGVSKPVLSIYRSPGSGDLRLFNLLTADAIWFQISNTAHVTIGGAGYYPSGTLEATRLGWDVNRTVYAYTLWFLNKHLKGSADPMPALADHPRILNFQQK